MKKSTLFSPKRMLMLLLFAVSMLTGMTGAMAQTNPTPLALPTSQDFGTTTFTSMPSGFAAWNGVSGASVTTQAAAEASAPTGDASVVAQTAATTTGGSHGLANASNARAYVQTSSNATNGANQFAMAINTVGAATVTLGYDVEMISPQLRTIGVVCQYRVGVSGSWTTLSPTSGSNPFSQSGGTAGVKTTPSISLPAPALGQPIVQIRWAIWRGTESGSSAGLAIDNINVTSTAGGGPPTKLVITNISPASPTAGSGFDVTVQAQDAGNIPQNVTSNTDATLTLNTGTGSLSGTLVGTIANGTNSIVISGVNYNVAETGVILTATTTAGMSLTAGNSAPFDVLAAADHLAFSGFPASGSSGNNISSFTVQALRPDLTVDNTYTGTVTLTKVSGAGNLAGTVSTACVAGVATFNAVQFDAGGTYVLEANSGALTLATSSSISILGSASITEDILPQYAINGGTTGTRLQYACRLTISDLLPSTTYRYFTGASTNASLGLSTAAGNFYVINNTAGANGYIVGQTSSKSFAGTLMGGDEFTTGSRYGEFTTDGSGDYTGWFGMVPTGNAVFNDGSLVYFYVQLNDGAGGTVMAQSIRTASTIEMIATATTARAARGLSNGSAEDMVFLYDNTAGTGRPLYGTWIESDGITPTYTTWYNVDVDGVTGSWGAYLPTTLANGVQRIESRNVQTGALNVCPGTSATGVWSGAGNTVNPTAGTTPIVFSIADASFANMTWYADVDGDGYGDAGSSFVGCALAGYVIDNTDCNDGNAAVNPGATEVCNGIDDDCDGLTDESGGAVHNVTANTFHCTIQGAINAATAGDVINVPAGTYPENVIVNKSLSILGPNAAIDACSGTRVAEAIIVPSVSSIDLGEIIHVAASNVTISGFTIDGDNTAITSGFTSTNGADIDAAEGVTVYETGVNNLTVSNNIIQNLSYFGVTLYDYPAGVPSSGHSIANNKIQNLGTYDATSNVDYWGGGVLLYNNQYAAITNNCMTNVRLGVQTGNFYQANPGAAASQVISGNTIQARRTGVFHNLHYSAASPMTFSGNTITALANANETRWDGIALSSLSVPSVSTNNIINGNGIVYTNLTKGYEVWNVKTPLTASSITGGSVSGVDIGVFANNYDGYSSDAPDGAHATISGLTITPNATGVGIRVYDNALATSHAAVRLDVSGCTISGGLEGIKFEETQAGTVGGTINNNNIGATAAGVNVTSMVTSASNVFSLTNNTITMATQVAGSTPTVGVSLRKLTGTTAALISGNNITGPFFGYIAYNLNTSPASDIDGGTITGVLQGVAFLNIDPLTFAAFAPSNSTVKNVSMNGFSGNYPALPNNNFHAGVYAFTTGADLAATLNVTCRDLTIDGTGKTSPASAGVYPADFSTGAGVRQTITVDSCTIINNLNRGISARGSNAVVDVNNCTLTNNGGDPFGAGGNDGFGVFAAQNAVLTSDNSYVTNPASVTAPYNVYALATGLGTPSLTATNNSLNNNGNANGLLANNFSGTLTATCNWWGTGNLSTIASLISGAVTYQPMLTGGTDNDAVMDGFQPAASCEMVLAVTVTGTATDETCTNLDNGSIDITAANGIAPYTYLWSNASTNEDQSGLDAGTYTVTVTDAYGNSGTNSFVVNPGATPTTWYADTDNDTYGDAGSSVLACIQPVGYVTDNTDCNDGNAAVNPGATEVCNGIDDDCDGLTDESGGAVHNVTANTFHCTIQGAINAATAGDVINVPAGTYAENVIVNKSVTLNGPNAAIDACSGIRVAEAIVVPSVAAIASGEIFHVAASNVTISGFTIDGDNTAITSGFTSTNGADIDAAEGVTVYETGVNNLTVSNNIIQNLSYFGVTLYDYPAGVPSSGHSINNNKIQNLGTYDATSGINYWGGGVLLYNNQYTAITNNCMTNVRLGVQTGNFYQANPGAAASQIFSGNTIQARRTGIFHNLHYSAASPITMSGNTITALANANETRWDGIALSSLSVPSVSTNNVINGNGIAYTNLTKGYQVWNVAAPITNSTITGGSVSGVDIGVFANNYDGYNSDAPDGAHATISGVTITPKVTGVGVRVYDNALATSHAAVRLDVSGCTISGGLEGIKFEETQAGTVGGTFNNNNIGATAVGVNVTSMVTSASNVFSLTNNTITIATQVAGSTPTVGVSLTKLTGTTAANISGNDIAGPFFGYIAYNLNTSPASDIDGGTITGVLQGVAFLNIDPVTFTAFAPSNTTVKNISMNGFSGNYPALPNNNFHAGVYAFTTGSDLSATLNVTCRDLTIDGTGKTSQASAAIYPADFSTGVGVRQTIVVDSCTLTNNLNRGFSIRGSNAVVDINNCTLTNNGGDPFGAGGNDGFGIIVREGSIVTADNNFITNPSSNVAFTVSALATDLGTSPTVSLTATNNSIDNNGNASGYLARNFGGTLTATCNWWGTGNLSTIASLTTGAVTNQPMLIGGTDADLSMEGFQPAANCETVLAVTVNGTVTDETCTNLDNGSIDITAANGIAPYTYLWSNSSTNEDQTGLDAGTYTVTVTDAYGNSGTNSFTVNPGATPTTWYADADGDTYGDNAVSQLACIQPVGYVADNTDCNDNNAAVNPAATEICNGIDDDCDGLTDDADPSITGQATWYADVDGDTYGNAGSSVLACNQPVGYVADNTDCNDGNAAVNPAATEVCNGIDDDCDGLTDEGLTFLNYYVDGDGDGFGAGAATSSCNPIPGSVLDNTDCDDGNAAINPTAQEICDGIDNDCDGLTDDADPSVIGQITWYADADGDGYGNVASTTLACYQPIGYILDNSDCNDANAAINPGATEVCNGIDDDCDGLTDDADPSITGQATWYADVDGDTYGNAGSSVLACFQPVGYVSDNTDCNDANAAINPAALEVCDGIDNDCDGLIDDADPSITGQATWYADVDGDTYGNAGSSVLACNQPVGYVSNGTDCDDNNAAVNPAATEVCNGIDDNCDGIVDNTLVPSLGPISGSLQQCLPISNGSTIFSVAPVPGVLTYTWTVPAGLTIVSGQGTNTLVVSWTSTTLHFGIVGQVSVTPNDACYSGSPSVGLVDINYTAPVRPPSISGAAKVCPGDVVVYSIANVARASSYLWTVPAGVNITSGQGTNIITATITGAFAGGVIDVVGVNVCGASPSRTKTMNFNIPGVPSPIAGITTGLCSVTGNVFSTAGTPAATSYIWSVPPGVTITSGQGTSTITVDVNGSFVSGSVFVSGVNGCGTGASRSVTITGTPGQAGLISGPITVCPGATGIVYQVATVGGANNYTWTVPPTATITSGQGTKIITVDYSLVSANNQSITVRTDNGCGQSPVRSLSGISINNTYCPRLSDANTSFTDLIVFPNPATDLVTIQFNAEEESNYRLRLTDMMGREIFVEEGTTAVGRNTQQIGLTQLSGGVYFVEIQSGEGSQSIRLMVE